MDIPRFARVAGKERFVLELYRFNNLPLPVWPGLSALTGDIMTMPGLPKVPAAEKIDVDNTGRISGLF